MSANGQWRMQWSDNGSKFDVTLHGAIVFTDDLTDVQSLSEGGVLTIRDWSGLIPHTVEIRSSGGKLAHTYFVGGLSRPWDDEARRFLATELPLLVRRSGLGAESRVKSIFEKKGVGGVLEEIDLLGGDYARRLYFVALVDVAHLDSNGVLPVLQRAGERMRSDYDRRRVLEHVASHVRLDQRGALAYVRVMAGMKSDYDQRQALNALTNSGAALDGDAAFQAIAHMKSSYDKRMVLADILRHGPLGAETKKGVLGAVVAMGSDYERRRVLTDVAKRGAVNREVQQAAFETVASMNSDRDRAEVLLAFVGAQGIDSASRQSFVSAAERLKSSYEQNRVLAALVKSERR